MIAALGAVGGAGLLLILAPLLWPRRARREPSRRAGAVAVRLERAGFPAMAPGVFVLASAVLGAAAGALVLGLTGIVAAALPAAVAAALAPWTAAGMRAASRARAARGLWPETVDHVVGALRSGVPLPDALAALASEGPVPLRPGFARFERRWRAGGTAGPALDELKAAFADPAADRIVEVLRMGREVGGTELPSVLRDLAAHLRQDLALRAEVEARQSWTVNAARLGLAAPWIVLALLATRPEAAAAYATPGGALLIAVAAVVTAAAYRVMLRLGRLPEDRRWFQ